MNTEVCEICGRPHCNFNQRRRTHPLIGTIVILAAGLGLWSIGGMIISWIWR